MTASRGSDCTSAMLRLLRGLRAVRQLRPDPLEDSVLREILEGATKWLNSAPLTPADLRGKVVLVNFWTYTCVNWQRQLPYVRGWAEKYKATGLVVLGVHTPEFSFEHNIDNVQRAAKDMQIGYPITVDSDYAVWDAFANHYWPAQYFVDATGRIRHHYFGEGAYDESELVLQQLLREAGATDVPADLVIAEAPGPEDRQRNHSPDLRR